MFMKRFFACFFCVLSLFSIFGFTVYAEEGTSAADIAEELISKIDNAVCLDFEQNKIVFDEALIVAICDEADLDTINEFYQRAGMTSATNYELVQLFIKGIDNVNQSLEKGEYKILAGGTIVETKDDDYYLQGGSTYDLTKWWGRRRYKSTDAASRWAYELNQCAAINAGAAVIGGAVFGGVGAIPNGITSAYCWMFANSVTYYNALSNRGIVADITWIFVYKVRKQ